MSTGRTHRRQTNAANLALFEAMRKTDERKAEAKRLGMLMCSDCQVFNPKSEEICGECGRWLGNKVESEAA